MYPTGLLYLSTISSTGLLYLIYACLISILPVYSLTLLSIGKGRALTGRTDGRVAGNRDPEATEQEPGAAGGRTRSAPGGQQ